jgi:hypothetical protein
MILFILTLINLILLGLIDDDHEEEFLRTVDFINMIKNEEYIFVYYYDKDCLIGDSCVHKDEEILILKDKTAVCQSYMGTYDKTYRL